MLLKEIRNYMNSYVSMNYYTDGKGIFYGVAFFFIVSIWLVGYALSSILLYVTCPIWLGPYLIFRKRKESKK